METATAIAQPHQRVRVLDISRTVRPLRVLGWANYVSFLLGTWACVGMLMNFFQHPTPASLLYTLLLSPIFGFLALAAFQNVGPLSMIHSSRTALALALMCGGGLVIAGLETATWPGQGADKAKFETAAAGFYMLAAGSIGLLGIWWMRNKKVPDWLVPLHRFLNNGVLRPAAPDIRLTAKNPGRGWVQQDRSDTKAWETVSPALRS